MNDINEKTLIEALDLLEQGQTVDEIVARYPGEGADLRPFLQTAAALATLAAQPRVAAQSRSRVDFMAAADEMASAPARRAPSFGRWARRLVMPLLAVVVAVFMGGTLLAGATGAAVPGSALYSTKRRIEEVRLNLAADPERAAALREAFRQERIREIEDLFAAGSAAQVELTGAIETMAGDRWQVAGLPVALTGGTILDGTPAIGAVVRVDGQTTARVVIADRIVVISAAPTPTPDSEPGVTPAPTPAAGGEESPANAATNQPEALPTPLTTPPTTPTPKPGLTATPGPSATPDDDADDADDPDDADATPDDNGDDTDDGNTDSGGDEDPADGDSDVDDGEDDNGSDDSDDGTPSDDSDGDGVSDP